MGSYQDELRDLLYTLFPDAKSNGARTEVMIPCPICYREGNPDHDHHMYIFLGDNNKPPQYNCFRNSHHHGLLTASVLENWSNKVLDRKLFNNIESLAKNKEYYQYIFKNVDKLNYFCSVPNGITEEIESKRQYICNRLGLDIDINTLVVKNKVIFNIKDFLYMNSIPNYNFDNASMDVLNKFFIGFLTNNNNTIIMRNIAHDNINFNNDFLNKRYLNYVVNKNVSFNNSYYILPSKIELNKHVTVCIAEGVFDILSIYYNLFNQNDDNIIYCAMGNNHYLECIQYFLEYLGIIDIDFHLFVDNDIEKRIIDKVIYKLTPLGFPLCIHNNTYLNEKDFGVPRIKINDNYNYIIK